MSGHDSPIGGDPADQSEKRDWDLPPSATDPREHHQPDEDAAEPEAPHPTVHGETPDEIERRDWEVP